jgi:hypothetical protein
MTDSFPVTPSRHENSESETGSVLVDWHDAPTSVKSFPVISNKSRDSAFERRAVSGADSDSSEEYKRRRQKARPSLLRKSGSLFQVMTVRADVVESPFYSSTVTAHVWSRWTQRLHNKPLRTPYTALDYGNILCQSH